MFNFDEIVYLKNVSKNFTLTQISGEVLKHLIRTLLAPHYLLPSIIVLLLFDRIRKIPLKILPIRAVIC